jgi:hypothetical protein
VSRPRTPLDLADAQALARIATLAAAILVALRQPGRGPYESERQLRTWLTDDGVTFTGADLAPALDLPESTKRTKRAAAGSDHNSITNAVSSATSHRSQQDKRERLNSKSHAQRRSIGGQARKSSRRPSGNQSTSA